MVTHHPMYSLTYLQNIRINIPLPPTHRRHHQNPLASSNRRARDLGTAPSSQSHVAGTLMLTMLCWKECCQIWKSYYRIFFWLIETHAKVGQNNCKLGNVLEEYILFGVSPSSHNFCGNSIFLPQIYGGVDTHIITRPKACLYVWL